MTLSIAVVAFFLHHPSLAFVVLHAPAVAKDVALDGHPRHRFGGGGGGGGGDSRSSPLRPLLAIGSGSSTSQNNVTPAEGLTTGCSTETQSGTGGVHRRRLHPESDVFLPTPCSAVSLGLGVYFVAVNAVVFACFTPLTSHRQLVMYARSRGLVILLFQGRLCIFLRPQRYTRRL